MAGEATARGPGARRRPEWLALVLHLIVAVFPYSASGLLAPMSGLVALAIIWLALAAVLWRWRPTNPWLALLVPAGAIAAWFVVLSLGDALLGWTA